MTKAIKLLLVALVLFSLSAGASWYLQQHHSPTDDHDKSGTEAPTRGRTPLAHARQPGSEGGGLTPATPRSSAPVDAEAVAQMAANLHKQMDLVRSREQQLSVRQKNLELIYQDIRNEQKVVDELRKQMAEELKTLDEKLHAFEKRADAAKVQGQKLTEQVKEIKQSILEVDEVERGRLKQMANVYDAMDPDVAADTFRQMAEGGKLDMAVKIMANMRERQAARILGKLAEDSEQSVAVQLLDRLKGLKAAAAKNP